MQASEMTVGMEVMFGKPRGEQRTGSVTKLNAKSAKIFLIADDGEDEVWTVPYSLIHPVGTDVAANIVAESIVDGDYEVGDRIIFGRPRGEKHSGVIMKVNAKTLMVQSDDGRQWRVKQSFIIRDTVPATTPEVTTAVAPVIIANDTVEAPGERVELTAV